ncbi:hypothetical protein BDV95DRAFT_597319 [Massariosphaeria phaeospora]|uniref:Uncharacterized protein n=1 Tax=Massariosphaeria phaeospora TaxID=100035 RepID=A0A7C8M5Q9_9PLEO|nr:hypothetical protein BDV95DRAFT_597319 [Massariosphaeria phaeospora]
MFLLNLYHRAQIAKPNKFRSLLAVTIEATTKLPATTQSTDRLPGSSFATEPPAPISTAFQCRLKYYLSSTNISQCRRGGTVKPRHVSVARLGIHRFQSFTPHLRPLWSCTDQSRAFPLAPWRDSQHRPHHKSVFPLRYLPPTTSTPTTVYDRGSIKFNRGHAERQAQIPKADSVRSPLAIDVEGAAPPPTPTEPLSLSPVVSSSTKPAIPTVATPPTTAPKAETNTTTPDAARFDSALVAKLFDEHAKAYFNRRIDDMKVEMAQEVNMVLGNRVEATDQKLNTFCESMKKIEKTLDNTSVEIVRLTYTDIKELEDFKVKQTRNIKSMGAFIKTLAKRAHKQEARTRQIHDQVVKNGQAIGQLEETVTHKEPVVVQTSATAPFQSSSSSPNGGTSSSTQSGQQDGSIEQDKTAVNNGDSSFRDSGFFGSPATPADVNRDLQSKVDEQPVGSENQLSNSNQVAGSEEMEVDQQNQPTQQATQQNEVILQNEIAHTESNQVSEDGEMEIDQEAVAQQNEVIQQNEVAHPAGCSQYLIVPLAPLQCSQATVSGEDRLVNVVRFYQALVNWSAFLASKGMDPMDDCAMRRLAMHRELAATKEPNYKEFLKGKFPAYESLTMRPGPIEKTIKWLNDLLKSAHSNWKPEYDDYCNNAEIRHTSSYLPMIPHNEAYSGSPAELRYKTLFKIYHWQRVAISTISGVAKLSHADMLKKAQYEEETAYRRCCDQEGLYQQLINEDEKVYMRYRELFDGGYQLWTKAVEIWRRDDRLGKIAADV